MFRKAGNRASGRMLFDEEPILFLGPSLDRGVFPQALLLVHSGPTTIAESRGPKGTQDVKQSGLALQRRLVSCNRRHHPCGEVPHE